MITEIEDISHLFELLPQKCIDSCHCSGDNYEACAFWVNKLGLYIPKDKCITILKEYAAWNDEELENDTLKELNIKLLWIAASYEGEEENEI